MNIPNNRSKKNTLGLLAPNWREKIFESIQSHKLKTAVAVLSATGCRPNELERGVLVLLEGGELVIVILGSKVNKLQNRGQVKRILLVHKLSLWGAFLKTQVLSYPESRMHVTYDSGGISQRLREKSRELWPRRKTLVSAYTYRHFIGKSMKESGEPPDKIAQALGHASDYSQAVYGRAGGRKKTKDAHGILHASATEPVRHSPKTDRLERFSTNKKTKKITIPVL